MNIFMSQRRGAQTSRIGLFGAAALMISAMPALAVTCDDVRALSKAEQNYWAKRLNITPAQRQQIRLECYGDAHASDTKVDRPQPVADRR
jgi:hypothetical protein